MSDFSASIKAILDTSGIPNDIKKIEDKFKINIKVNGLDKFDTSGISKKMANAGASAGRDFASAISKKINNGGIESSIAKVKQQYQALNNTISNLGTGAGTDSLHSKLGTIRNDLILLNNLQTQMNSGISGEELVSVYESYNQTLTKVKNNLSTVYSEVKQFETTTPKMASSLDASKLSTDMSTWLSKNSKASKDFGGAIQGLIKKLDMLSSTGKLTEEELKNIKNEFVGIKTEATAAGKTGATLGATFKRAFESISKYVSASTVIYKSIEVLKQMFDNVVKIDTAMTDLYKVTDETDKRYNEFLTSASKNAKELGRTISSLVEQTANWAKLGYSLDEAEELAKLSSIYANVGEVDDDKAVSDMVTAMKAFNIEATEAQTIVDSFNELGNNFATSAADLGEGLTKSASAMAAAGTDLYKTLAMLTGGTEITQNASEFGNFLKTASMRIRGKLLCLHMGKVYMRWAHNNKPLRITIYVKG